MPKKKPHFVVIGGGTGTFMQLCGLKEHHVDLSVIVSMADDGGSTGDLRDQYGVLPPGDVRRALVALSQASTELRELFNYRFSSGDFAGHSFGNLFLSVLEKIKGDFGSAVLEASRILSVRGKVIPVTLNNVRLHARLMDGSIIRGETNIDIPRGKRRSPIAKVWLSPRAAIYDAAEQALRTADVIVIGPGDLFTSLIPNLLVDGMPEAIRRSRAKKVYVCNLMTKFGETHDFTAMDFVQNIERYLGKNVLDAIIFNTKKPSIKVLQHYKKEQSEFVDCSTLVSRGAKPRHILEDVLDRGELVRHDPKKLARILLLFAAVE